MRFVAPVYSHGGEGEGPFGSSNGRMVRYLWNVPIGTGSLVQMSLDGNDDESIGVICSVATELHRAGSRISSSIAAGRRAVLTAHRCRIRTIPWSSAGAASSPSSSPHRRIDGRSTAIFIITTCWTQAQVAGSPSIQKASSAIEPMNSPVSFAIRTRRSPTIHPYSPSDSARWKSSPPRNPGDFENGSLRSARFVWSGIIIPQGSPLFDRELAALAIETR